MNSDVAQASRLLASILMGGKRPAKELRGFQRVTLRPGEKRTLTFALPAAKLTYWDETAHAFVVNPGAFEILVGASSEDIRETARIRVTGR